MTLSKPYIYFLRFSSNPYQHNPGSSLGSESAVGRRRATRLRVWVSFISMVFPQSSYVPYRFGLLHRIPPIPEDREPGALPPELRDSGEFEEQTLYVPADVMLDHPEFDSSSDPHDRPPPFFSPPLSHDYSYTYSNRGAALAHHSQSPTIPEEYEGTESLPQSSRSSQDLRHTDDSNHYHDRQGHDHHHDNGHHDHRVRTLPTSHRIPARSSSLASDVHSNGDSRS